MNVPEQIMRGICLGRAGLVEIFLYNLRNRIDEYVERKICSSSMFIPSILIPVVYPENNRNLILPLEIGLCLV